MSNERNKNQGPTTKGYGKSVQAAINAGTGDPNNSSGESAYPYKNSGSLNESNAAGGPTGGARPAKVKGLPTA